jgi:methionyl-tRNA formyltransferase
MGLVIITGDGPEHRYVTNAICSAHKVDAILLCDPPKKRSVKSMLKKAPLRVINKVLRAVFLRAIGDTRARTASLSRVLGSTSQAFAQPNLVDHVGRPRAGKLADRVSDLSPDIMVIYGTGIIPDDVLAHAGQVALNMHTGQSPWYRGVSCAFWPMRDMRPDMVGATVHECTSDVDGGLIYARKAATLQADDDLHAVFARAVEVGAHIYVDVVERAVAGSLSGEPQDLDQGIEFHGTQMGIMSELGIRLGHWRLRRSGRLGAK